MMCRITLCSLPLLLIVASGSGEWLEFNAGAAEDSSPIIRYNTTEDEFISFDVETRGLLADSTEYDSEYFWRFTDSPGTRTADSVGYPELPVVTCFVIVPDDTDLDLHYMASCDESIEGLAVYPAPLDSLVFDNGAHYEEFFRMDSSAYASTEWYPEDLAELSGEFMLRDQRVAIVDVHPVQYLASEDSLRVWSDIEVMIEFEDPGYDWSEEDLGPYEHMIGDRLIGYRPTYSAPNSTPGSVEWHTDLSEDPTITPDYIIIAAEGLADDAEEAIDDFAEYRANLNGFDVLIANAGDIYDYYHDQGENYLLPNHIRDYTEDIWEFSEGDRPSYLLLIGDHETYLCASEDWFLPTKNITTEYPGESEYACYGNDEWYVYFDESRLVGESFPDMIVGRLPARDTDNLEDMLALIEDYEEAISGTPPTEMQYRRYITRLSGTDNDGEATEDSWFPSASWTEDLKDWMGYNWDNYYCGDGEDTSGDDPPNPDGSSMTSEDWVNACKSVFERGSQVAFYIDHGDFHMFSAGLNWTGVTNFGVPDSTFNDKWVLELNESVHWPPFILMLCCSAGTFNHTYGHHETGNEWMCLCHDPASPRDYDFLTDCLAEDFVKNTDCGAIGVVASSGPSWINAYDPLGTSMLKAIYYRGISRMGDALQASRIDNLDFFWLGDSWSRDLGCFNLLGDPALDIGDRMKYRGSNCDLVISPDGFHVSPYPTSPAGSSTGTMNLQVTVRNTGWAASDECDAELAVNWEETHNVLEAICPDLDPGESTLLSFEWSIPSGIEFGDRIDLIAEIDTEEECTESWTENNSASSSFSYWGSYPNDDGWPLEMPGSVKSPPVLADLNGDGDLEIIAISGWMISAISPDDQSVLWEAGPYHFRHEAADQGYSVIAIGDVAGTSSPEVVVDTQYELVVFGNTGTVIDTFEHGELKGNLTYGPHGVTLADVYADNGKLEITVVCPEDDNDPLSLFILNVQNNSITELDQIELPNSTNNYTREWICAYNLTADTSDEIVLSYSWSESSTRYSGIWIYDHDERTSTSGFTDKHSWVEDTFNPGIQSIGRLTGSVEQIALSRRLSESGVGGNIPVYIIQSDDLSDTEDCSPPDNKSNFILCSLITDWDNLDSGLDRIIAPAENQCMVWEDNGDIDAYWGETYGIAGVNKYPPFPALANLVEDTGYEYPELIVGTRTGWVNALDRTSASVESLGFPYQLPAEICGGFVVADIDLDEKLEVVFGTMDNFLHVWELDDCIEGYAPWLQCQRDATRPGTLMEE